MPSSFAHNEWLKNAFKFIDDHQNNTVVDNDCVPTIIQSFLSETLRCHSMAAAVIATAYQNVLIGNSRRFRRGHVAPKDVDLNIFVDLLSVNAVLNKTSSYRIECDPWPWAPALTVSVRAGPVRARWASSSVSLPSRTAASEGTPPVESSSAVPCESPDLPPGRYHCRWCRYCCCCYYCFRLCTVEGQGVFLCRRMWFLWRFVGWRNANC